MDRTLFNRTVDLLKPYMKEDERQTLITLAFSSYPDLYSQIEWAGAAHAFTVRLVRLLKKYGNIEDDIPALTYLLDVLNQQVGLDVSREINKLLVDLKQPEANVPLTDERKNSIPRYIYWTIAAGVLILLAIASLFTKSIWEVDNEPTPMPSPDAFYINPIDGTTYLYISAGEFMMGSSDDQIDFAYELCTNYYNEECQRSWYESEQPQHNVYLDGYWIMKTEVTNAQYHKFMEADGYNKKEYWSLKGWSWLDGRTRPICWDNSDYNGNEQPVVCISWYEAEAYTNWLSASTGLDFGLPTEAEWEKAARGVQSFLFPWGNDWDSTRANYCDKNCTGDWVDKSMNDSYQYSAPVGSYPLGASPYGVLDMAGNVWEWTTDWYASDYYVNSPSSNPTGPKDGNTRVVRGGTWYNMPSILRAADRSSFKPNDGYGAVGFRVRLSSLDTLSSEPLIATPTVTLTLVSSISTLASPSTISTPILSTITPVEKISTPNIISNRSGPIAE